MPTKTTVTEVPFDTSGNLLHYVDPWTKPQWRPNEPFVATLFIVTVQSGRSAKYLIWADPQCRRYPMFVADAVDLMCRAVITNGQVGPRTWVVRKRGQNYGVALAPER